MSDDDPLSTPLLLPRLLVSASPDAVEQALVLADALATGGIAPDWPPLRRQIYAAAAARTVAFPDAAQRLLQHPRLVSGLAAGRTQWARAAAAVAQPWQQAARVEVLLRAAAHDPDLRAEARAALDDLESWDRGPEIEALGVIALPEALRDAQLARMLRDPVDPRVCKVLIEELPERLARSVLERTLESVSDASALDFTLLAAHGLMLLRPRERERWLPVVVQALCNVLPQFQFVPWLSVLLVSHIGPWVAPAQSLQLQSAAADYDHRWRACIRDAIAATAGGNRELPLAPVERARLAAVSSNTNATDALIATIAERWTGAGPPASAAPSFEDAPPAQPAASAIAPFDDSVTLGVDGTGASAQTDAAAARPDPDTSTASRGVPRTSGPQSQAPGTRRIQARVGAFADGAWTELSAGMLAGVEHEVEVSIGRRLPIRSDRPLPEPEFAAGVDALELELLLLTDDHEQRAQVLLPRDTRRDSGSAIFHLTPAPGAARLRALVVVLHAGSILQAAELDAPVLTQLAAARAGATQITLRVHPWTRALSGLEHRRPVDAGVLADTERAATLSASTGTGIRELSGVRAAVDRLTQRLFEESARLATRGRDLEQPDALALLRFLCVQGWLLYRGLVEQRMPQLRDAERIQIVTLDPSAHLPLELIYDHGVIRDDARLCPRWRESLLDGGGCEGCPNAQTRRDGDICPRGFWALRKVIERQPCHETDPGTFEFLVHADPGERGRDTLMPMQRALWGTSEKVSDAEHAAVGRSIATLVASSTEARDWQEWVQQVAALAPTVMVALPHKEHRAEFAVDALELGRQYLNAGAVDTVHVYAAQPDAPRPLLLLLGCRTALGDAQPFQDFVSEFRGRGAAAVVGTIATILAEDAALAAQRILEAMAEPAPGGEATLGEALLRVRQRLFARGMVIALALAAFGDGDWKLAVPPRAQPSGDP